MASRDPLKARPTDLVAGWGQVCGWRLARQGITAPGDDPVEVTARIAGVQAQVTSSAELTLGLRTTSTPDVSRLLWDERALVRTWAMRGTLHWLPAREFALWTAALRTREWRITPGWERYHGVTAAELDAVTAAIPAALEGRRLTRDELAQRLAEVTGNAHLHRQLRSGWGAVLKPAANQGLLCFGPDRGRNVTFVRPQEWLGGAGGNGVAGPAPSPEEALRTVLRRFLDAYGPATHKDFGRWFGVPERPAREVLAAHAEDLVVVEVDGLRAWLTPRGAEALARAEPADGVHLLGGFDPYVLAPLSHRAALIPDGHIDDVSRAAGWISAVVLVDGAVAGTWTVDSSAGGTVVAVTPFAPLPAQVVGAISERADALGARGLLPGPVTVQVGAPTA